MIEPLLDIRGVTAGYKPGLPILREVSAHVDRGEIVTLIGPNGAGKSTLVKAVAGFLPLSAGSITFDGNNIGSIRPDQLTKQGIAYIPQTENIFRSLTVKQNLVLAAQRFAGDRPAAISAMLELFPPLAEFQSLRAGGLSGGQRQMLAIAMALVASPRLILMDEPTAGLSPKVAEDVLQLIQTTSSKGISVMLVEQNAKAALAISDRAYVLAEGQNQHEGRGRDLLKDPLIGEIYLGAWRRESA